MSRIQRRNRGRCCLYFQWRLADDLAVDAAQYTPQPGIDF